MRGYVQGRAQELAEGGGGCGKSQTALLLTYTCSYRINVQTVRGHAYVYVCTYCVYA